MNSSFPCFEKAFHIITDDDDEIPNSLRKVIQEFHIV